MPEQLHLSVALDGAGWHPAAWRELSARPTELFTADYWVDLVQQAERGLIDFVTIEDSFRLQTGLLTAENDRTDQLRGRLDAVLIADRVGPLTHHIGLVPTALVTHTEPFHISKAIATLDYITGARAGIRAQVSHSVDEAAHFGRRQVRALTLESLTDPWAQQSISELFDEAADFVEVIRRLWDSWEDDAEIRDAATGQFIFADLVVFLDGENESGADRRARLDRLAGHEYRSDAYIFTGSASQLADLLVSWQSTGISGYRLRPAALPDDLGAIIDALVPELQSRNAFRTAYEADTLRGLLGRTRPANRYATLERV